MSAPNGHAGNSSTFAVNGSEDLPVPITNGAASLGADRIAQIIADLAVPFDPSVIEWRVTNTAKAKSRGQVIPYADQRAYTDRLNALFTPFGWTRKYAVNTSTNFQRGTDQKTVAKVIVTCELKIFGLGSHSATGEDWADNENAATSAEAQAFKRACSCFGLGRYLYYFEGAWVDLDQRKRPKSVPRLPNWATPEGWAQGLRRDKGPEPNANAVAHSQPGSLVPQIEAMAKELGRGLYRGILRDLARVWSPREIADISVQQRVLEYMHSAARGLRRLEVGVEKTGREALVPILNSLGVRSLKHIDRLETLKRVVLELERIADGMS
jgi:hypothetical protein